MSRTFRTWQQACAKALLETDESKVLAQIGCAVDALARRYAEWGDDPGPPEELTAILRTIKELDGATSERISQECYLRREYTGTSAAVVSPN